MGNEELIAERAAEYLGRILSPRERETFLRLGHGVRQTAIALDLGLSSKTVSTFAHRAIRKMRMRSPADIVAYCVRNGLA